MHLTGVDSREGRVTVKNNINVFMGLALSGLTLGLALTGAQALAGPVEQDQHIQHGDDAVRLDIDRRTYNEIQGFLKDKMSTASVLFHAVNMGVSINDAVYLAVKADRELTGGANAAAIYEKATELLPYLPGWACNTTATGASRYSPQISINDLGKAPTVQTVADRYFQNNERLGPFPRWKDGDYHMVAELGELKRLRARNWDTCPSYKPPDADVTPTWYRADPTKPRSAKPIKLGANCSYAQPVFVSLYRTATGSSSEGGKKNQAATQQAGPTGQQATAGAPGCIIVDDNLKQIERAEQQGCTKAPVVFLYNEPKEYPVTALGKAVRLRDIVQRFWDKGERTTPVPDEHDLDRHLDADQAELWDTFKDEIKKLEESLGKEEFDKRVNAKMQELAAKGLGRPIQVTLMRNKGIFTDELLKITAAHRATAAGNASVPRKLPTVVLFQELNRLACGVGATTCWDLVCEAAVAGGADPSVCTAPPAGGPPRTTTLLPPPPPRSPSAP